MLKPFFKNSGNALVNCVNDFIDFIDDNNCKAECGRIISFKNYEAERYFENTTEELTVNHYFKRMAEIHDGAIKYKYGFFYSNFTTEHIAADLLMCLAYYKITAKLIKSVNLSYISRAVGYLVHHCYRNASFGNHWLRRTVPLDGPSFEDGGACYDRFCAPAAASPAGEESFYGVRLDSEYNSALNGALKLFENNGKLSCFRTGIKQFLGLWLNYYDSSPESRHGLTENSRLDKHGLCVIWDAFENHLLSPADEGRLYDYSLAHRKEYDKKKLSKYYERTKIMKNRFAELKNFLNEFALSAPEKLQILRVLYKIL